MAWVCWKACCWDVIMDCCFTEDEDIEETCWLDFSIDDSVRKDNIRCFNLTLGSVAHWLERHLLWRDTLHWMCFFNYTGLLLRIFYLFCDNHNACFAPVVQQEFRFELWHSIKKRCVSLKDQIKYSKRGKLTKKKKNGEKIVVPSRIQTQFRQFGGPCSTQCVTYNHWPSSVWIYFFNNQNEA